MLREFISQAQKIAHKNYLSGVSSFHGISKV